MTWEHISPDAPGELVETEGVEAFVPDPLPPRLEINLELLRTSSNARGKLGELVGEARLVRNKELVIRPLLLREAVLSNRIEGTHTQVSSVLLQDVAGPSRDPIEAENVLEVVRYLEALSLGTEWIKEGRPLGLHLIRSLHEQLLRDTRGKDTRLGDFRREVVYLGSRAEGIGKARFIPPPYEQVPPAMENLAQFLGGPQAYDVLIDCAIQHYQFEAIHPFMDGNGRLGRLLIPLFLMSAEAMDEPYLYLSSYFEANRDEYLAGLKAVSSHGRWQDWILFFLAGVSHEAEQARARARRILDTEADYRKRLSSELRSRVALSALDLILEKVFVTIPQVAAHTHSTYDGAKAAVESLQRIGILQTVPSVRSPRTWVAGELLDLYEV